MNEQIALLLALLLAHVIADFYLQPLSWVMQRNERHFKSPKLALHMLVHGALSGALLWVWECYYGLGEWLPVLAATAIIMASHWLIDVAKSYSKHGFVPFIIDQGAHILILVALSCYLTDTELLGQWFSAQLMHSNTYVLLLAYLLVLNPSSVAIRMLLERWHLPASIAGDKTTTLPQAGHSIGLLERLLMLTFIIIDELAGVGFVLAAKSVFRFGDLTNAKDKQLTEYVMLGTLLSVVITLGIGLTARALLVA
ncbi:DUF3307 domain-containing protein [Pseudoalteromonas sp. T1lg75]|uniref:DUF3307 domain-containing protein n=1 Tax=Pseudoalteromonas sp. T1lg75 TaxID=2077102 RepID=UPI000CF6ECDC|nr:DUF3307 domain-containing protein [Pseudoalteromonas sp. T1lg75]